MSDFFMPAGNTDYARQLAQMLMPQGQQPAPNGMGQPQGALAGQQMNPMQMIQQEQLAQQQRIPRLLQSPANYSPEGM